MKEILRVEKIKLENWLYDYSLSIHQGEMLCVHSPSDTSINCLMDVLSGERKPDSGQIYVDERKAEYDEAYARKHGIYVLSFKNEYSELSTVLESINPLMPPYRIFSRRKIRDWMKAYFAEEQVAFDPDTEVWRLTGIERKKLGILRAKLQQARLVIINMEREIVEGKMAEELFEMIVRLNQEGMTFLILSCYYTFLMELAGRIQFLHQGRALKEWYGITAEVREKLKYGNFFQMQKQERRTEKNFIGLYDYEWDLQSGFWIYLHTLRKRNPQVWGQYCKVSPPEAGVGYRDRVAVVPKNSQNMLIESLGIGENLTIAAGSRISYGHSSVINPRLQKKVEESFYRNQLLEGHRKRVDSLSDLQKKILSIARFEILRPTVIFLELPYAGISMEEIPVLQEYLNGLVHKGIKIIYFAQSLEHMLLDCSVIIQTQNGQSAKIDTFS